MKVKTECRIFSQRQREMNLLQHADNGIAQRFSKSGLRTGRELNPDPPRLRISSALVSLRPPCVAHTHTHTILPSKGGYHGADSTLPVTSFGLRCWAQWHWYFTHFKLFYFPNVIGLVQWIVRFVMRTEPKASYRTVQYEYAYRYTPNIYIYIFSYAKL